MLATSADSRTFLEQLKAAYPDVDPLSQKFRILMTLEIKKHKHLTEREIINIFVGNFGIPLTRRPTNIPDTWKFSLSKEFLAPKYENPDSNAGGEYVIVAPPVSRGNLPCLIHRRSEGWADAQWFLEVVPELEKIINASHSGIPFSRKFNAFVNQHFGNQMTPGQLQAFNLFFEKFVPGINGICTTCFNISLPESGAGERWSPKKEGHPWEIRLSAAKPWGKPAQREEYVSQVERNQDGKLCFATWNKQKKNKDLILKGNKKIHTSHGMCMILTNLA